MFVGSILMEMGRRSVRRRPLWVWRVANSCYGFTTRL